jgi:hypothetical protein
VCVCVCVCVCIHLTGNDIQPKIEAESFCPSSLFQSATFALPYKSYQSFREAFGTQLLK